MPRRGNLRGMGPPCPTCGTTLTWYPQTNAWGCERCRVMLSPAQIGQPPQQPAYPQAQPPYAQAQPPYQAQPQYPHVQQPSQAQPQPYQQSQPQHAGFPQIPKTIPINTFEQQQQGAAQLAAYPQAQGYPQAYAQPQAATAPAQVRSVGKSNTVLLLAGAGVVIAAGIAIAVVMTRGGSDDSIGAGSRDELVNLTYKSLAAGDVDGLMKRTGMPGVKKYFTCDKDKANNDAEELAEIREEIARATARLKGATIKVGKITGPEKPEVMDKGTELGDCKLDTAMESHSLKVQLDILHANGTEEKQQAEMQVSKISGRWIFTGVPTIPGCYTAIGSIASSGARETKAFDAVNSLQPVLMSRCLGDAWGPTVLKCLEGTSALSDAQKCLAALSPKELAPLTKEVDAALASVTGTGKELRQILPDADDVAAEKPPVVDIMPPPPTTPADPDAALVDDTLVLDTPTPDPNADDPGRPEQAEQADFWLWTRSDGAVRVTSPVVKAVFPGRPEQVIKKGAGKTLDGKEVWLYQFIYDLGDDGQLRLELSALGRGATQSDKDPLVALFAKIGKVKRKKSEINGVPVVDLEAVEASSGGSLRARAIRDLKRGLMIVGVAATSPKTRAIGTQFLASVAEVMGADPIEDPLVLADMVAKKVKKKYVASTASGDFSIELPIEPKFKRIGPSAGKSLVTAAITAENKKSQMSLQITEHASWDALMFHPARQEELANEMKAALEKETGKKLKMTPGRLAGVTGYSIDQVEAGKPKLQFRMMWNRYQHRTFMLLCIDAPCDAAVDSIKFADPSAE